MWVRFKAREKPIKGILSPDFFVTLTWTIMLSQTAAEFRNDLFFRNILNFALYIQNYLVPIQRTPNYNQHDIITHYDIAWYFKVIIYKYSVRN